MSSTLKYALTLISTVSAICFVFFSIVITLVKTYAIVWYWSLGLVAVASIAAAAAITLAVVATAPFIKEYLATLRRLWRLENLSHPLLIKLSQEAPSTYFHSIIVANLSHRAAKAIGADPILCRLGGYYHDIGKLVHPEVYIENSPDKNYLAQTDSSQAAKKIIDHVRDGLKLAREYDLPPDLTSFITQHHGTTLAGFFYEQAKAAGQKVLKQNFRYPGPKPLSRETAILMLADSCEAKIRTLSEYTDASITQAVDEILENKANDGQLELSGLSASQLRKVRGAFIESLKIMNHRRIKYGK